MALFKKEIGTLIVAWLMARNIRDFQALLRTFGASATNRRFWHGLIRFLVEVSKVGYKLDLPVWLSVLLGKAEAVNNLRLPGNVFPQKALFTGRGDLYVESGKTGADGSE